MSNEDGRLHARQREELYRELEEWVGIQCTHPQTQVEDSFLRF